MKTNNLMPAILDRQIAKDENDAFGHRHFARALRSIVESDKISPPYSIGLLGDWGTGKSSIKDLYLNNLEEDETTNTKKIKRRDRFQHLTFNAWRFGGKDQDIKRALLRHVYLELGGSEDELDKKLFSQIQEEQNDFKYGKGWRAWLKCTWDILCAWAMPVPAFFIALLGLWGAIYLFAMLLPENISEPYTVIFYAAICIVYSYLLNQFKTLPGFNQYKKTNKIEFPLTSSEQYETLLVQQLKEFKLKNKKCERLIIFVDDLDRLSAEEMVQGLDAVRTFMEMPKSVLPKELGLVFVISCDETRVAEALSNRRWKGDLPGVVLSQSDARRYLDRIFQFRLEIPPFPRQDMRNYGLNKLKELSTDLEPLLQTQGTTLDAIVEVMIHVGVQTPRNALQIVNAFTHAWWLAKKRENEGIANQKAGGLSEGAVTSHPLSLAALSALKVDFPEFYKDLLQDSRLLNAFIEVVIRGKDIAEQPASLRIILEEKYLEMASNGNASIVSKNHRPLRQFLSSVSGLLWPNSLDSLLKLSEDPVTRKYGAKAINIYNALLSADTAGVLEELGRNIDNNPLSPEEISLLSDMMEDVRNESESRRVNASKVIANLVNRLPEAGSRLLIANLCRELGASQKLRSQLGIQNIKNILHAFNHADIQKTIASNLVYDILPREGEMTFTLETMEKPTLDQALSFAHKAVEIILPIYEKYGLDPNAKKQFTEWLLSRRIEINQEAKVYTFETLERWMTQYEDLLIEVIGSEYAEQLVHILRKGSSKVEITDQLVSRVQKIFENLYKAGNKSKTELWQLLAQYVALKPSELVQTAFKTLNSHHQEPDKKQLSEFVEAFAKRIGEDTSLLEDDTINSLHFLVKNRSSDLNEGAINQLSNLAILWSNQEGTSNLALNLTELLHSLNVDVKSLLDNWCSRILEDLPDNCIEFISKNYDALNEEQSNSIYEKFNKILDANTATESDAKKFDVFSKALPNNNWNDDNNLNKLLTDFSTKIYTYHQNQNDYLLNFFPVFTKLIKYIPDQELGTTLHSLFANTKIQVTYYGFLHMWMVGDWPTSERSLPQYNPEQIFTDGFNFLSNNPANTYSDDVLDSLNDMLERKVFQDDRSEELVNIALHVWKADSSKAVQILSEKAADINTKDLADLIDTIDINNDEQKNQLVSIWEAVKDHKREEDLVEITELILVKEVQSSDQVSDITLTLWLECCGQLSEKIIAELIIKDGLSDIFRLRLLKYMLNQDDSYPPQTIIKIISTIITLDDISNTIQNIDSGFGKIKTSLASGTNESMLSQELVASYPNIKTTAAKVLALKWVDRLTGDAHLKNFDMNNLTEDDLSLMENQFGASKKAVKNLRRKWEKNSNK